MTEVKKYIWATEAEALAFVDGVEFVNDSAIEIVEIAETDDGKWAVWLTDEDA